MNKRVTERVKSLLIVLLAGSAVFLASRTSLSRPLSDLFFPRTQSDSGEAYPIPTQRLEMARPVAMAACIPGEGRTLRYGVQYDAESCDALFQRGANLLAEALSSAGAPRQITRQEWEGALTRAPGLYFDFLGQLPLEVLSGWLSAPDCTLTGTVRRMALTTEGEQVLLCYYDTQTGAYYACAAGVVNPDHLGQAVSGLGDNGAFFAFEEEDYALLAPDTLLLAETPQPEIYDSSSPISGENGLMTLLDDLYFPGESTAFYSTGDEQVARNGGESLRLSRRGVLEYSCDTWADSRYLIAGQEETATLADMGEYCRYLAQQTVGSRCGKARLYLSAAVQEEADSFRLDFDYCLNGIRVSLEGGAAASFRVERGKVVQFTLRLRTYSDGDQTGLLLPQRQAMAVLEQMGQSGALMQLLYTDKGGETVSAQWAAETEG